MMDLSKINNGQMKALRQKAKQASEEHFLEQSRKRLDAIITKKMKTAFIGALAAFEEEFGSLWGHGLQEHELSQDQRDMRDVWERVRTSVLNNGNTQLRSLRNEIANHSVRWNRYYTQFVIKTEESENE